MFAVIKLSGLLVIGAVAYSIDPFIAGGFTLVNTALIARLNARNEDRTARIMDHLEETRRQLRVTQDA